MIVISTGWAILKLKTDEEHRVKRRNVRRQDPFGRAFYPLTMPLTVGSGSISVAVTLGANALRHGLNLLAILVALLGSALIAVSIFLYYGFAARLARILGATAMTVITQLASFLLVCIGVQILWNGVSALLASVHLASH